MDAAGVAAVGGSGVERRRHARQSGSQTESPGGADERHNGLAATHCGGVDCTKRPSGNSKTYSDIMGAMYM